MMHKRRVELRITSADPQTFIMEPSGMSFGVRPGDVLVVELQSSVAGEPELIRSDDALTLYEWQGCTSRVLENGQEIYRLDYPVPGLPTDTSMREFMGGMFGSAPGPTEAAPAASPEKENKPALHFLIGVYYPDQNPQEAWGIFIGNPPDFHGLLQIRYEPRVGGEKLPPFIRPISARDVQWLINHCETPDNLRGYSPGSIPSESECFLVYNRPVRSGEAPDQRHFRFSWHQSGPDTAHLREEYAEVHRHLPTAPDSRLLDELAHLGPGGRGWISP